MDAKQFAWLYLVQNGYAGMLPSYYGGYDTCDERVKEFEKFKYSMKYPAHKRIEEKYLEEIKEHGVDWKATRAPKSDSYSSFTDTFHDPETKECLRGVLVLKNGLKQTWCSEPIAVTNVFEMMAMVHEAEGKFHELFKE